MENQLIVAETLKADVIFVKDGEMERLIDGLEAKVRAIPVDISTATGRAECKSLAYMVARSKTAIDDLGKTYTADLKKTTKAVDEKRKLARDRCEALQEEVRRPLTEWESVEQYRIDCHESTIADILSLGTIGPMDVVTTKGLRERIAELDAMPPRVWEEFETRATEVLKNAKHNLTTTLDSAVKREAEQAELAAFRKQAAERDEKERQDRLAKEKAEREEKAAADRKAREEKIAAEAAEKAKAEHERQAQEKAAAQTAAAEKVWREQQEAVAKAERDRLDALRRAEQVEADAKAAADRSRQDALDRAAREQAEREQAKLDAAAATTKAVEDERQRVAAAAEKAAAEKTARETNRAHKAKIDDEVIDAIYKAVPELLRAEITAVVRAIAQGKIPHTKIEY